MMEGIFDLDGRGSRDVGRTAVQILLSGEVVFGGNFGVHQLFSQAPLCLAPAY